MIEREKSENSNHLNFGESTAYEKYDFQAEVVSYKSKKLKNLSQMKPQLWKLSPIGTRKICKIADIEERETTRKPVAPFTTSTIQQEASLKLGFSPGEQCP